jgi:hypothetical protein
MRRVVRRKCPCLATASALGAAFSLLRLAVFVSLSVASLLYLFSQIIPLTWLVAR